MNIIIISIMLSFLCTFIAPKIFWDQLNIYSSWSHEQFCLGAMAIASGAGGGFGRGGGVVKGGSFYHGMTTFQLPLKNHHLA